MIPFQRKPKKKSADQANLLALHFHTSYFCEKKHRSIFQYRKQLIHRILISGSLESPLSASSSTQAYHPSSTYFHHECQWFFDPPPAKQLILKISTAQKMSKYLQQGIQKNRVNNDRNFFAFPALLFFRPRKSREERKSGKIQNS